MRQHYRLRKMKRRRIKWSVLDKLKNQNAKTLQCAMKSVGFLPFTLYHISFADVIGFRICNSCKKLLNSILSIFDTVYPFFALTLTTSAWYLVFFLFIQTPHTQSIWYVSASPIFSICVFRFHWCRTITVANMRYYQEHTHKMVQCSIS